MERTHYARIVDGEVTEVADRPPFLAHADGSTTSLPADGDLDDEQLADAGWWPVYLAEDAPAFDPATQEATETLEVLPGRRQVVRRRTVRDRAEPVAVPTMPVPHWVAGLNHRIDGVEAAWNERLTAALEHVDDVAAQMTAAVAEVRRLADEAVQVTGGRRR